MLVRLLSHEDKVGVGTVLVRLSSHENKIRVSGGVVLSRTLVSDSFFKPYHLVKNKFKILTQNESKF